MLSAYHFSAISSSLFLKNKRRPTSGKIREIKTQNKNPEKQLPKANNHFLNSLLKNRI